MKISKQNSKKGVRTFNRQNNPKTRKEIRKDKRQQKKINRFNYHSKKKTDRIKEKEDYKQGKSKPKKGKEEDEDEDDEEIPSDFGDSGDETAPTISKPMNQHEKDRQKELAELKSYENGLKDKRIEQLLAANEDDDKVIGKYEKLLNINRKRSKDGLPKSFNDGLDYALELCTSENIQKMYEAAKEAADVEAESDNEFQQDFETVSGTLIKSMKKNKAKKMVKTKKTGRKRIEKLKEIEKKYFGDDDLDSLGGNDSELEDIIEEEEDEYFDEDDENVEDHDSEEEEQEVVEKKTKKVMFSKAEKEAPKKKKVIEDSEDSDFDIEGSDSEGDFDEEEAEDDGLDEIFDEEDSEQDEDDEEKPVEKKKKGNKKEWEDIYGRKRDKDGNVIEEKAGKYIPPHLRAKMESEKSDDPKRQEQLMRLKKQLKGHINRLAETNVHRISIEMDNLYMQNARFDMNTTLTSLILEALISSSLTPERMVLEHMLLIAILHANVGSEVGARFLETVVENFTGLISKVNTLAVEDKNLDNIILILCHLYTFQIFKHQLIYDLMEKLIEHFNEKAVECILLVLKSIGFVLRKDDPIALKDLIIKLQKKASDSPDEFKNDPRVKYMLETLMAIKNNNMNKIPQYDPTLVEHFRKLLKGMVTSGKYVSTLNITLDDLLNVDERGKWWLVGSAWSGNKELGAMKKSGNASSETGAFSQKLLELAKKQRMNTDDRKNVFCIIMSAEDYIDAFDKILHLSLKDQRIIVSVILHCCLSEKEPNPYYSVLSQKFCDHDRKYQLAFQFALWDKFKDLNSLNAIQIRNLAKLLIYLIGQGGLAISVLKVIEFGELDKTTLRLVRQIMMGLLLEKDEICQQVFNRVSPSLKLKAFKDSLRLFLHHFLLKGSGNSKVPEEQMELLKSRIKIVDKCLETMDSRIKF